MPAPSARQTNGQPLRTRALTRVPASVDVEARRFTILLASEAPVRTWVQDTTAAPDEHGFLPYIECDEILLMSGVDLSRAPGMPLVDAHDTNSIDRILGVFDDVRVGVADGVGGSVLFGDVRLVPSRAALMPAIAEGFYPQASAGFIVDEYEKEERAGQVPVMRATRWRIIEGSLVPVGADANAGVRSVAHYPLPTVRLRAAAPAPIQEKSPMDELEAAVAAAEAAVAAIPAELPADAPAELVERVAKVRAATPAEAAPAAPAAPTADETAASAAVGAAGAAEAPVDPEAVAAAAAETQVRALADKAGFRALADAHFKAGFSATEVRSAVSAALVARSAGSGVSAPVSITLVPPQEAAPLNVREIFAAMNKRA